MGGRGSGGRRPGGGRKPKRLQLVTAVPDGRVEPVVAAVGDFPAPAHLTADEQAIWGVLAPLAVERQTLTAATALGFEVLCRSVVLERQLAASADRGGSSHRAMIQRVDAELLRFDLAPNGKPHGAVVRPDEKPQSALERMRAKRLSLVGGRV